MGHIWKRGKRSFYRKTVKKLQNSYRHPVTSMTIVRLIPSFSCLSILFVLFIPKFSYRFKYTCEKSYISQKSIWICLWPMLLIQIITAFHVSKPGT